METKSVPLLDVPANGYKKSSVQEVLKYELDNCPPLPSKSHGGSKSVERQIYIKKGEIFFLSTKEEARELFT